MAGIDAFGRADTFEKVFEKLLSSYALDVVDLYEEKSAARASKDPVTRFMKSVRQAALSEHPSVGVGTDCRIESRTTIGFALLLDGRLIHLLAFTKASDPRSTRSSGRMQRFRQRRRQRVY